MITALASRGLSTADMNGFTVGQVIDYVLAWNDIHYPDKKQKESSVYRIESQEDWDQFRFI